MALYALEPRGLAPLDRTSFVSCGIRERQDLQRVLRDNIAVLDPDLLVIAEEFGDWEDSKRRIDLLAIERSGNLVVVELKRTDEGGHMELQALRYAAMVAQMTIKGATETLQRHLDKVGKGGDAHEVLREFLGADFTESQFAGDVRIVLVSQDFSREVTTTVMWLLDHDVDIRCYRLQPYEFSERILIDLQQVLPLPEASDYQVRLREKEASERRDARQRVHGEWQGHYYVNIDDGNGRAWEDCRRYGFIGASGGQRYIDALRRLVAGDPVYAYQKERGYVGSGVVREAAVPVREFRSGAHPLLECDLVDRSVAANLDDDNLCEWVCRVDWHHTLGLSEAVRWPGMFANQNVVCRLRDRATIEKLTSIFGT